MTLKMLLPEHGNYGFRFIENFPDPAVQIDTIGFEKRVSTSYHHDGNLRPEKDRYIFQYTLKGFGIYTQDGKPYRIEEGQAFITRLPGNHSYYLPAESSCWEFIYIKFFSKDVDRFWEEIQSHLGPTPVLSPDSPVIKQLLGIYREASAGNIADAYQCSGLAYQFLMALIRSTKNNPSVELPSVIEQALQQMSESYCSPIGVEEIALSLGVSKHYLIRQFTRALRISPGKYLVKLRLQRAAELLLNTDLNIDAVAKEVGFSCGNYFTKVFRRYLGTTPADFRTSKEHEAYTSLML